MIQEVRFNIRLPAEFEDEPSRVDYVTPLPLLKSIFGSEAEIIAIQRFQGLTISQHALQSLYQLLKQLVNDLKADEQSCFLGTLPKHLIRASRLATSAESQSIIDPNSFFGITPIMFRERFVLDSTGSSQLELFLEQSGWAETYVAELVAQDLEFLITHKFGNYILQKLMNVHNKLFRAVSEICHLQFTKLVTNEFSSRVMQNLVENSTEFRTFAIGVFKHKKHLWLKNIAGLFVLNTCMKKSEPESYKFVEDHVFANISNLESSKNLKRALVSLVDSTPISYHIRYAKALKLTENIPIWLNDKYLTYLLIAFVRCGYQPAWDALLELIRDSMPQLLKTRYLKLLLNKFISLEINGFLGPLHEALVRIKTNDIVLLASNIKYRSAFEYLLLLVVSTANLLEPRSLCRFLNQPKFLSELSSRYANLCFWVKEIVSSIKYTPLGS